MNFTDLENYIGIDQQEMEKHSFEELQKFIYHFMLNIPFEAIDVFNGDDISMDVDKNLDKFVNQKRGGLCYENNLVANAYLSARGFDTKLLSGYVKPPNKDWKEMDTHLTTLVTIDGKEYIADTGFGHFPSQPIPLDGTYVYDEDDIYRIIPTEDQDNAYYVQTIKNDGESTEWTDLLFFENVDRELGYFDARYDFTINHPKYAFKKMLMINKKTPQGHNTMSTNNVTITTEEGKEKIPVTADNYRELLKKYFGLDVRIPKLENEKRVQ
ncbi:TPA: arylamine N-acetyltransferase [Staphylococcus delphini]|nr:arylamine N-acetyltransferase [Staphylococcus delphini]HEC2230949.1 arylamine N-acetyltransferase [Staphylococcus delphini]